MLFAQKLKSYFANIALRSPKLSDFAGAAIVAAKKHARAKKNDVFDCFVIPQKPFLQAIAQLNDKNINREKGIQSRTQALVRVTSVHFTYVDIQNTNGELSFFILDAAGAPEAVALSKEIQKQHPNAKVFYCLQRIQKDGESCFNFSLSHAESFSKIKDWHSQLSAFAAEGILKQDIQGDEKQGPYILERKHIPIQAFKQAHRQEIGIKELLTRDEVETMRPVNKYDESLSKHLQRHQIPLDKR
ncbi:YopJ family acetyltransferase [Legionella hackeliae]|uniref:Uncharacterized protein n=1 Tax=Legionella hackeliae TaxID=449 RepID=A0A0A8UPU8_LEGHA|nr:YopJ family acetyltransferase [Legionella hackeliae]KTD06652.1 Dot/Icm T4SS effector [Legionella hackeliae]CEK10773.1 protein of unknown function [Legionella hackeliae]STX47511.1 Dot/Icm T4SS effector [Legionella hackeliae]